MIHCLTPVRANVPHQAIPVEQTSVLRRTARLSDEIRYQRPILNGQFRDSLRVLSGNGQQVNRRLGTHILEHNNTFGLPNYLRMDRALSD